MRGRGRRRRLRGRGRKFSIRSRSRNYLRSRNDPDYYDYYGEYDYNGDYYHYADYYYDEYYNYDLYDYNLYDYNLYDYGKQRPSTSISANSATSIKSMPAVPSSAFVPATDIDPGRNPYPPSGQRDGGYGNPAPTGHGTYLEGGSSAGEGSGWIRYGEFNPGEVLK